MWVDCTSVSTNSKELCDFIREKTGLFVTSGDVYRNADGFMRVNIACPRSVLEDGLKGDEWYKAYKNWWSTRHHFNIEKEWLMFCTGVIPALSSIVRKLTTPAENVVVMTPVYNHFFSSILNKWGLYFLTNIVYICRI